VTSTLIRVEPIANPHSTATKLILEKHKEANKIEDKKAGKSGLFNVNFNKKKLLFSSFVL
jgi:hypothetical protein